jgi:serine/threonine protein kinase
MKCPNHDVLLAYHTGGLGEAAAMKVIPHISVCPDCQADLKTLGDAADTLVARLRSPAVEDPYAGEPQQAELAARAKGIVVANPWVPATRARPLGPAGLGRLGEYELLAKLGEGGMGAVYQARHTRLKRVVALKVLPKDRMTDPRAVARFEREMEAVGKLSHPNIVLAHDARDIDGTTILVMEYVEGFDLAQVARQVGALQIADACELVRQAALGLQYAHQHGLVHRDIKPSNLMLTREGRVKILDLGLALLGTEQPGGAELTSAGQAMGTADYMAPEQASDAHAVDIRADIYSLGCTLYKLLTGRAPFTGPEHKSPFEKMIAHVQQPIRPIRLLRTDVPEALAAIVARMLAKKPDDRFATPDEVAEAISPFAVGADLPRILIELNAASAAIDPQAATEPRLSSSLTGTHPSDAEIAVSVRGKAEVSGTAALLLSPSTRRRVAPWTIAIGAASTAIVLLAGIILHIATNNGTVKIELSDPQAKVEVRVDDDRIDITGLDQPLHLRVGKHTLLIRGENFETIAKSFTVRRGDNPVLRVEFKGIGREDDARRERDIAAPASPGRAGRGLLAELFEGTNFDRKVKERVDRRVDCLWGFEGPDPDLPADFFSIRWSGWIKAPQPGRYGLVTINDDGVRVALDGRIVIDDWIGHYSRRRIAEVDLTGKPHAIRIEYFDEIQSAVMSLRWIRPGSRIEEPVPAECLFCNAAAAENTPVHPPSPSPVTASPADAGSRGLLAELFLDRKLTRKVKTRVDYRIDWLWGYDAPDPDLPEDGSSIRWTGMLHAPRPGRYTLIAVHDDGVRIWLDGRVILDEWHATIPARSMVEVDLTEEPKPIRVEFFSEDASELLSLRWILPAETEERVIGGEAFSHDPMLRTISTPGHQKEPNR